MFEAYRETGFQPIWLDDRGLNEAGLFLLDTLQSADLHGLDLQDYNSETIATLMGDTTPKGHARLDLALTNGFLRYSHDISEGRSIVREAFPELFSEAGSIEFDPALAVQFNSHAAGLRAYLDLLTPQHR